MPDTVLGTQNTSMNQMGKEDPFFMKFTLQWGRQIIIKQKKISQLHNFLEGERTIK